jgi:hypothetical protein
VLAGCFDEMRMAGEGLTRSSIFGEDGLEFGGHLECGFEGRRTGISFQLSDFV